LTPSLRRGPLSASKRPAYARPRRNHRGHRAREGGPHSASTSDSSASTAGSGPLPTRGKACARPPGGWISREVPASNSSVQGGAYTTRANLDRRSGATTEYLTADRPDRSAHTEVAGRSSRECDDQSVAKRHAGLNVEDATGIPMNDDDKPARGLATLSRSYERASSAPRPGGRPGTGKTTCLPSRFQLT